MPVFKSGIVRSDIPNGLINSPKILDASIRGEDQAKDYFIQTGLAAVDTALAWVAFGTPFADTAGLQVIPTPLDFLGDARINAITAGSFEVAASEAGSIRYTAIRVGA